jgi:hypothetical protein
MKGTTMRRVILESPYAAEDPYQLQKNEQYGRLCMLHCLQQGEAPFASHLLYTQVLDDRESSQRAQGILAGYAWGAVAEAVVVYVDYGVSPGMKKAIDAYQRLGLPIEHRKILETHNARTS